jgi:hypothetical protein
MPRPNSGERSPELLHVTEEPAMTRTLLRRCARVAITALSAVLPLASAIAQEFVDGLAQPVFAGQPVISHNVWAEVPNLDTDRDGANDRIRIHVRRRHGRKHSHPADSRRVEDAVVEHRQVTE